MFVKLLLLFFLFTNVQPIEEAHNISKAFLKLNLRPAQGSYKKKIVSPPGRSWACL